MEVARPINEFFHLLPSKLQRRIAKAGSFFSIEDADKFPWFVTQLIDSPKVTYPDKECFEFPITTGHIQGFSKAIKSIHSPSHIFRTYLHFDVGEFTPPVAPFVLRMRDVLTVHPLRNKLTDLMILYVFDFKDFLTQTIYQDLYNPTSVNHYWDHGVRSWHKVLTNVVVPVRSF